MKYGAKHSFYGLAGREGKARLEWARQTLFFLSRTARVVMTKTLSRFKKISHFQNTVNNTMNELINRGGDSEFERWDAVSFSKAAIDYFYVGKGWEVEVSFKGPLPLKEFLHRASPSTPLDRIFSSPSPPSHLSRQRRRQRITKIFSFKPLKSCEIDALHHRQAREQERREKRNQRRDRGRQSSSCSFCANKRVMLNWKVEGRKRKKGINSPVGPLWRAEKKWNLRIFSSQVDARKKDKTQCNWDIKNS